MTKSGTKRSAAEQRNEESKGDLMNKIVRFVMFTILVLAGSLATTARAGAIFVPPSLVDVNWVAPAGLPEGVTATEFFLHDKETFVYNGEAYAPPKDWMLFAGSGWLLGGFDGLKNPLEICFHYPKAWWITYGKWYPTIYRLVDGEWTPFTTTEKTIPGYGLNPFVCTSTKLPGMYIVVDYFSHEGVYEPPILVPLIATQVAAPPEIVEPPETTASVLYVRSDGIGSICDSWENACGLQTALLAAEAGNEIWVKAGIYKPAADTSSPAATFQLKEGVAVYGGFAGTETTRDQRNWETNITVLSGDLGGDDITDPNGVVTDTVNIVGKNAYHVVFSSGVDKTAVLDGFVITAGYASQTPPNIHGFGGGMFMQAGSPTLNNLIFSGNTAGKGAAYYGGGAMYISFASNPVLTHVTFRANTAGGAAGMFNDRGSNPVLNDVTFTGNKAIDASCMGNYASSSPLLNGVVFDGNSSSNKGCMVNNENSNPILTDVTFSNNTAKYGSGMYNYQSSPTLTDVVFSNNVAGHVGGAMENEDHSNPILNNVLFSGNSAYHEGGGMFNIVGSNPILTNVAFINNSVTGDGGGGGMNNYNSSPVLTNVTFSGNHAIVGGGIGNWQSSLTLMNVTFSKNTADQYGSAMYSQESTPTIINTIIWGNTPGNSQMLNDRGVSTVSYSIIAGGHPGTGNLNVNPKLGELADNGGFTLTYSLPLGSPAIDTGSLSACPPTDQRGMLRPVDGDGDGVSRCDMGAFEYQAPK